MIEIRGVYILIICFCGLYSCKATYVYKNDSRVEEIEIRSLLKTFKYSCIESDSVLVHRGPVEENDSMIFLIFPLEFEEMYLSPFAQNEVYVDSTNIDNGSKCHFEIHFKSKSSRKAVFGFAKIYENNQFKEVYKSTVTGELSFEVDQAPFMMYVQSYSTLISRINLSGTSNYQVTIFLADKQTENWHGCEPEEYLKRKNYPVFRMRKVSESMLESLMNNQRKIYTKNMTE